MPRNVVRITLDLPPELHEELRLEAAARTRKDPRRKRVAVVEIIRERLIAGRRR